MERIIACNFAGYGDKCDVIELKEQDSVSTFF